MKLNHFICPNCGHDFFDSASYSRCDACQCVFYASQSRTCRQQQAITRAFVNGVPFEDWLRDVEYNSRNYVALKNEPV